MSKLNDDWASNMIDMIEYAEGHLEHAKQAVKDEGCTVLEGLLGAHLRITQAIDYYFAGED